ncbi:MAG: hypothetical protein K2F63_02490, partial [Muribaculaceae bacterium]|nr:hypothetical protein [Muribaculaceae bacterium]
MNSIESHIRYLLIGNGHVAVPGIGVLSRSWLPASFEGDRLIAPSETVSFQPDDSCDGSSLIASVARAESIPMADAAAKVSAATAGWIHRLSLGMSVDIAEVGTLNAVTSDGSIAFVPDVNSVGSRVLPWLPVLALEPI